MVVFTESDVTQWIQCWSNRKCCEGIDCRTFSSFDRPTILFLVKYLKLSNESRLADKLLTKLASKRVCQNESSNQLLIDKSRCDSHEACEKT